MNLRGDVGQRFPSREPFLSSFSCFYVLKHAGQPKKKKIDHIIFIHKFTVIFFSSEKFLVNIQIVLLNRTITVEILLKNCGV